MGSPFVLIDANVTILLRDIDTSSSTGMMARGSRGRDDLRGIIKGLDDNFVYIEDDNDRKIAIPLTAIAQIVLS